MLKHRLGVRSGTGKAVGVEVDMGLLREVVAGVADVDADCVVGAGAIVAGCVDVGADNAGEEDGTAGR